MVFWENCGVSVPWDIVNERNVTSFDGCSLVIVKVYVCVVVPSSAVTTTYTVFSPTFNNTIWPAPNDTRWLLTFTVANELFTVGVTVIDCVEYSTDVVYVIVFWENCGVSVPWYIVNELNVASFDGCSLVIVNI